MPSLYRAFGLTLQASRPIPGLSDSSEKAAAIDVYIDLESGWKCRPRNLPEKIWYQSPKDSDNTLLTVWRINQGAEFYFRYSDGIEFRVHRSGGRISAAWPAAAAPHSPFVL